LVALSLTYLFMAARHTSAAPAEASAAPLIKMPVDRASVIRRASDATVFIESPWGVGSGFVADGQGHVVTNLHVVEITPPVFETLEEERKELKMFLGMTGPSSRSGGFASADQQDRIREARDRLDKVEGILRDYWVAKRAPFLRVVTNSDRSFSAVILKKSADHDLALLKVEWSDSPHVPLGSTGALSTGDQVFAIGSPMGIRRTVTSGIVSGKVTIHSEEYLQTDAPINPGNSGGPLISETGEVVGVNTMTVANAQGLGFAIPIETVKTELGLGGGGRP
jgi:S1-C subfamily serine protease